jgi:hypothetical protein
MLFPANSMPAPAPASPPTEPPVDYVELRPGWRVRVVVPNISSGGYVVRMGETHMEGNTIVGTAGKEFVGYETDYYEVEGDARSGNDGGIRIRFRRGVVSENEKLSRRREPGLEIFPSSSEVRFLRLVYLVRQSSGDHDMVIVGASARSELDQLTTKVAGGDLSACAPSSQTFCKVVSSGIAVAPEERLKIDGKTDWRPAR